MTAIAPLAPMMEVHPMKMEEAKLGSPEADMNIKLSPRSASSGMMHDHTPMSMNMSSCSSLVRKPPRKSTLTQQQKNQKRQRATQDQLGTLEIEFNKNPTPTAAVRERIAMDINMTERSVQIWFQNRRAKIKNLAKRSIETGEDCDAIPESMRKYLAIQALESGKPLMRSDILSTGAAAPYGNGFLMNDNNASKIMIHHINCHSLCIGSWRRIGQTALDLVVFYSPAKSMITYYINADSSGFRIEYPFSYIKNITLDNGDVSANAEGAAQQTGGLIVELNHAPNFSMDPGSGGWFACRDFTEDQQATQVLTHRLGGHPKVLSGQLAKLVSLESFRNRHAVADQAATTPAALSPPEINVMALSAPVSPVPQRPLSQPNNLPHTTQAPFLDTPMNGNEMGPPAPRGHKRQRSRSVPVAIDFSQYRQQMTPIYIQQNQHIHMANSNTHIFAPVPQHGGFLNHAPGEYGQVTTPGLNIDTTAAGYTDFRPGPLSATTEATPPSEFDSTFYSSGPSSDTFSVAHLHTPFQGPFLSPLPDAGSFIHPSVSPMSALSNGEPLIANNSPPLGALDGDPNEDIYTNSQDPHHFTESSFTFNDMYSKQPISLPFRSPLVEQPQEDFDFQNMVNWYGSAEQTIADTQSQDVNGVNITVTTSQ